MIFKTFALIFKSYSKDNHYNPDNKEGKNSELLMLILLIMKKLEEVEHLRLKEKNKQILNIKILKR